MKSKFGILRVAGKALKWLCIVALCLVLIVVLLLGGLTLWLTPPRLTRIVNTELSRELGADVKASNVRFTLWSTFPHLCLQADSLSINSRAFDSLPAQERALLPSGASRLLSTSALRGGVNLRRLIHGCIALRDVEVDSLQLNFVALTDSITNYEFARHAGVSKMPRIEIDTLRIRGAGSVAYTAVPTSTSLQVALQGLSLLPVEKEKDSYKLSLAGLVTAQSEGMEILHDFPFSLSGNVGLKFKPFGIKTKDYAVNFGTTTGRVSLDADFGGESKLSQFDYRLDNFTYSDLLALLPPQRFPILSRITADVNLGMSVRLLSPYIFSSMHLPSARLDFTLAGGSAGYQLSDGEHFRLNGLGFDGSLMFDGENPRASRFEIHQLKACTDGVSVQASGQVDNLADNPEIRLKANGDVALHKLAAYIAPLQKIRLAGKAHFGVDASCRICQGDVRGLKGKVSVDMPAASMVLQNADLSFSNLHFDMNLRQNAKARKARSFAPPSVWMQDAFSQSFARHTPVVLHIEAPASISDLIARWDMDASISIARSSVKVKGMEDCVEMRGFNGKISEDSLLVSARKIWLGDTRGRFAMRATNLRQVLTSHTPAPLRMNLDLAFDTVQTNHLARMYAIAHPEHLADADEPITVKDSDNVAMLIPRNIDAKIRLRALQTRYINLHLYNLYADMEVSNGVLNLDSISVEADFGKAHLHGIYDTSNLQRMNFAMNLGIEDVTLTEFFKNFHQLVVMMPEVENFSGTLSAHVDAGMLMFPSMYLNVPSVRADILLGADSLRVKQTHFIRRVTRMLLLPDQPVLSIADMQLHAAVHDNLLEVFPFEFEMSRYRLTLQGLNNFDGDIYYHVGVDRWPLRLPFGINIKGSYHHPKLRFGGAGWKSKRGAEITQGVEDYNRINMVSMFRHYGKKLVNKAATYDGP